MDIDDIHQISSLELLPDEILFDILLRLDIPELHSLSMVNPNSPNSPNKFLGKNDANERFMVTDMSPSTPSRYRPIPA